MSKEPFLLNIETSTDVCSVAVSQGEKILATRASTEPYKHAELLTTYIKECLKSSGLSLDTMDAVAIASGPGSYTSLRVGTSTAKGICYSLSIPLISVDTLRALALAAKNELKKNAIYCPMIDARRMEVYCAFFDEANLPLTKPMAKVVEAGTFESFFSTGKTIVFTGTGAMKCREILSDKNAAFHPLECSAEYLPALAKAKFERGDFESAAYYTPTYLKPPNITKPKNMRVL